MPDQSVLEKPDPVKFSPEGLKKRFALDAFLSHSATIGSEKILAESRRRFQEERTQLTQEISRFWQSFKDMPLLSIFSIWVEEHPDTRILDHREKIIAGRFIKFQTPSGVLIKIRDLNSKDFLLELEEIRCRDDLSIQEQEDWVSIFVDFHNWISLVGRVTHSSASVLCPKIFACLTGIHAQSLLHEAGHALASMAVFKNAQPKISIFPFTGGKTKYCSDELTFFGNKLGKRSSFCLVTVAGPAASLLISTIAIVVGVAVQAKLFELGCYLITYGKMDFYQHACYALTAMFSPAGRTTHDFVLLSTYGLHPLVAAIAMFAIPLLI